MKKYLVLLLLLATVNTFAQTVTRTTTKLDENTVVKDGEGNLLPYIIWQKLLQSGEYQLKRMDGQGDFLIYKMNEQEKEMALKRKEAMNATLPRPRLSDAFKDGEKFKGDRFTDINGNKYDLKQLTGKVLVFNFWFINCPPCRQEIPELNQLYTKYKDNKDVIFLAIALDEKFLINNFLKKNPFLYNIVPNGNYYADKYNVSSYPTHLVVGKDNLVKFHTAGLASNTVYWVEKTIKEQLAQL